MRERTKWSEEFSYCSLFIAFGSANANNLRTVYSGVLCQRNCPTFLPPDSNFLLLLLPPLYYLARHDHDLLAVFLPERVERILVYPAVEEGELIAVPARTLLLRHGIGIMLLAAPRMSMMPFCLLNAL
jgi:hypothetical protein